MPALSRPFRVVSIRRVKGGAWTAETIGRRLGRRRIGRDDQIDRLVRRVLRPGDVVLIDAR